MKLRYWWSWVLGSWFWITPEGERFNGEVYYAYEHDVTDIANA